MAFTPNGMFYLSQKDLQPSMDTLGTGFRGMLGLQNKEEAIDSILQSANYDTPEGRQSALNQIKAIDPTKWEDLNKKNQDYELSLLSKQAYAQQIELQNKSLELKQEEQAAQKRVPKLGNWWDANEKQGAISYWLKVNHDEEALKDVDFATMTEAKAKALLRKIHKGGAGAQIKTMEASLAQARNTHIINNKFNPDAPTSAPATKDGTFLFNGEAAGDKPNLGGTQIPVTPAPAWQQGKGFWDDVNRQDTDTALPSDEIY
jgi:hypothetical protein